MRWLFSLTIALGMGVLVCGFPHVNLRAYERNGLTAGSSVSSQSVKPLAYDQSLIFSQIPIRSTADREAAAQVGTIIEDYGSYVVVAVSPTALQNLRRGPASNNLEVTPLDTTVSLRGLQFDPLRTNPGTNYRAVGGFREVPGVEADYYLVQFVAPVRDSWLDEVRSLGGEVIQYVPNQAFLVYGTPETMAKINQHPRVRWVGAYQPVYKAGPALSWVFGNSQNNRQKPGGNPVVFGATEESTYDIAIYKRAGFEKVANQVTTVNGSILHRITLPNNYFNVIRARLKPEMVKTILSLSDVIAMDPYYKPTKEDERANQIIAGNYTSPGTIAAPGYNPQTQFGVNGQNVTVSVVDDGVGIPGDGGFYTTATNAKDGPLRGAAVGADGHGHLNATIIAGDTPFGSLDPTGYNYGLGVAPKAHIVNIPFLRTGYTGTEADTANDTLTTNGVNGVPGFISSNSWGNGTNSNAYDSFTAQFDGFVRDGSTAGTVDPLLIIFSAGNQGTSGLTRPKVAKNLIAVAASENLRSELDPAFTSLEEVPSFSSRGLAADGRIKPDITAPGDGVSGGRSGPDVLFGNIDTNHRWSSGTSHACPLVSGGAALFTQFWKNGHAGANPSPALVKAALINGAVEMTGTGATSPIPNGDEGWGRMNLKNVLNTGIPTQYIDQTQTLSSPGDNYVFTGTVADATKPLRVTLVWTDPPALNDPALVNNLDLEVSVGGNTYKGNVLSGGLSIAGGSFDTKNNVENVFLPAGLAVGTTMAVKVTATALNGDGVLGNADLTDQHFALVVVNATAASLPVINADNSLITAQNCAPANGAIDPGETVTLDFALRNIGTASTTNLTATLQATGGVVAPSAAQNYGALNSGGGPATRSFTFTASSGLTCGGVLTATFALQDGATNLGTVSFNFTVGALGAPATNTYSSGGISVPIPDNNTVTSTVNVPDSGQITDVNVKVRLNHTFDGDIALTLIAPDNTSIVLSNRRGSSGDNYGSGNNDCTGTFTVFDDAAATAISAGTPPYAGSFKPDQVLSALNGKASNGTWTLSINDDATQDTGTLFCWQLEITRSAYTCCSAAPGSVTVTGFAPIASAAGKTIVVKGTGFTAASQVFFGGTRLVPAASVTFVDAQTLNVVVPASTTGNGNINGYLTVVDGASQATTQALADNSTPPCSLTATFSEFVLWGDITGDGLRAQANDVALARAFTQFQATPTVRQRLAADVVPVNGACRGDGTLGATDIAFLRAVSFGQTDF
ncbi:MAG: S8 family serine peptidase [Blastocatellia bacterium]|nr:S8 family serine peptidase [Blastocatellia bacterium]